MTASQLIEASIEFCCDKEKSTRDEFVQLMQRGYKTVHSNFRYALAKKLCQLFENERNLRAVYVHGSTIKDNARISSDIDLVLHVERKEKKLFALIERLNSELLNHYKKLIGEEAVKITRLLDVQLVDDKEVQKRTGYGVIINSLFNRPLKIWNQAS